MNLSIFLLLITCFHLYLIYLIGRQSELERTKAHAAALEKENQNQIEHYQQLYEQQDEIRKISHDMKDRLIIVSGMLHEGKIEETYRALLQYHEEIALIPLISKTGIASLDAILAVKSDKASRAKIKFFFQYSVNDLKVEEQDFSILIANALENAIEACLCMEAVSDRYITLKMRQVGDYVLIEVRNSFQIDLQNKDLATTKSDAKNHGFGIKIMESITKKYDGNLKISQNEKEFLLTGMLKNIKMEL